MVSLVPRERGQREGITHHLGLLADAIRDALLEALEVLGNVSLLFQQHLCVSVSENGNVPILPVLPTMSSRAESRLHPKPVEVVARPTKTFGAQTSQS